MAGATGVVGRVEVAFGTEGELSVFDERFAAFRQVVDKAFAPGVQLFSVRMVGCEVGAFTGVVFEVEQLFFAGSCVEDVLLTTIG